MPQFASACGQGFKIAPCLYATSTRRSWKSTSARIRTRLDTAGRKKAKASVSVELRVVPIQRQTTFYKRRPQTPLEQDRWESFVDLCTQ
ncbi:unnamed protein product [Jaminaea pallidilutea]